MHGLSIPLAKAGYHLPRTISQALSTSATQEQEPIPIENISFTHSTATRNSELSHSRGRKRGAGTTSRDPPQQTVFQIGRPVVPTASPRDQIGVGGADEPARPVNLVTHDNEAGNAA